MLILSPLLLEYIPHSLGRTDFILVWFDLIQIEFMIINNCSEHRWKQYETALCVVLVRFNNNNNRLHTFCHGTRVSHIYRIDASTRACSTMHLWIGLTTSAELPVTKHNNHKLKTGVEKNSMTMPACPTACPLDTADVYYLLNFWFEFPFIPFRLYFCFTFEYECLLLIRSSLVSLAVLLWFFFFFFFIFSRCFRSFLCFVLFQTRDLIGSCCF